MKEIMAIVRMNAINRTKRALADAGISSMTARMRLEEARVLSIFSFLRVLKRVMKRPFHSLEAARGLYQNVSSLLLSLISWFQRL
jgi:hypothetical protein